MDQQTLDDLKARIAELDKQLAERANLYRLMGSTEIGEEFERLRVAELSPIAEIVHAIVAS